VSEPTAKKPDILLIVSDQHNASFAGCYGHPIVKTPHIDRLAAEGVLFERAYCPYPVCGPSRHSYLSGRYPHAIECWDNYAPLASDVPTFAHALGIAGYEVVLDGRAHFRGPDQRHGFEDRLVGDINSSYWGGSFTKNWVRVGEKTHLIDGNVGRLSVTHFTGPGGSQFQEFDRDVLEAALGFIRQRGQQPHRRPFCLLVGFMSPHHYMTCPQELFELYDGRVDAPPLPDDHPNSMHPYNQRLLTSMKWESVPDQYVKRARAAYCGLVTKTDWMVGELLGALEQHGLNDNTLIVYFADHGEMAGEHGLWWKHTFYEGASRVPFIVSFPGRFPAGRRVDDLVSLVDLLPSLCDWTGAPRPPKVAGLSVDGLMRGELSHGNRAVFSELYVGRAMRMVRKGPWKYNFYHCESPELFNLEDDPNEFRNLAADQAYRAVREELEALLLQQWDPKEIQVKLRAHHLRRQYLREWSDSVSLPDPDHWDGMKPPFPDEWEQNALAIPEYARWLEESGRGEAGFRRLTALQEAV
jgi:choline-sulfatase